VALTIAIGLAITAGNVLLPVIIRRDFGSRQGPVVAGSTAAITASGTLGAALTAPLALWLGWRWALASWAIVTCIGILTTRFLGSESDPPSAARAAGAWRVPGAWVLTAYFGLLASLFYVMTVWLPTILPALTGVSDAHASAAASTFQAVGIVGAFFAPYTASRLQRRSLFVLLCASLWVVCIAGLMIAPQHYLLWTILGGTGQGCVFAMMWSLIALRSSSIEMVRDISGMAQAVGYTFSTIAPVAVGMLFQASGSWRAALFVPLLCAIALTAIAPLAAVKKPL